MSLDPALFTSAKSDGPDSSRLQPSSWNRVTSLLNSLLNGTDATGALAYRNAADATDGASWLPAVATGSVLVSGGIGVAPAWSAAPALTSLTLGTPLAAGSGGTGLSSFTIGDLPYASGAAALSKLAAVASGSVLVSAGVGAPPGWSATPTLTSLGIGAVPYANNALYLTNPNGAGLHIKAGSSSNTRAQVLFENASGSIRAAIDAEGNYFSNGWLTISGGFSATQNANGDVLTFVSGSSGLTTMLDVISDVAGPTIVAKATSNGYNFQGLDVNGNYTFSIGKDGALQWGAGNTFGSMDTFLSRASSNVLTSAGALTLGPSAVGSSTSTYGLSLINTTAATAITTAQGSPSILFRASGWNTNSLVSENCDWSIGVVPTSGNPSTSVLNFFSKIGAGAQSNRMNLSSAGQLTVGAGIDTGASITIAAGQEYRYSGRTLLASPANAQFNITNNARNAGVGVDVATDAVLKVRTTAQSAYATVDALGYKASGVAGVSFGPGAVTSITVVNGIVTAIS